MELTSELASAMNREQATRMAITTSSQCSQIKTNKYYTTKTLEI